MNVIQEEQRCDNDDEDENNAFEQEDESESVNNIETSTECKATSSLTLNVVRSQIKETLADIKQTIYLVDDYAEIKDLLIDLNHLNSKLKSKVSSEAGLPLIPKSTSTEIKTNGVKRKPVKYLDLPARKKKKSHWIRQKAEEIKNAANIKVTPKPSLPTIPTLIIEDAPNDGFGDLW